MMRRYTNLCLFLPLPYYQCEKFGDFSFSRFGFIVRTNTKTRRITHRRRDCRRRE